MVKIWKFPKYLKVTEVILVNCNLAINSYQQNSRVLYTFLSDKPSGQILGVSPKNFVFLDC